MATDLWQEIAVLTTAITPIISILWQTTKRIDHLEHKIQNTVSKNEFEVVSHKERTRLAIFETHVNDIQNYLVKTTDFQERELDENSFL